VAELVDARDIKSVAIAPPLLSRAGVVLDPHRAIPLLPGLLLQKLLPSQPRLPIQVAPKRLLQVPHKVLELLRDRCYFPHGV
jgi:hypothetical protein